MSLTHRAPALHYETAEVARFIDLLLSPGQITELRALDAVLSGERRSVTATGYFDDSVKLVDELKRVHSAKGIYIIPNPVDPALLARAANRIRVAGKGDSTADINIVSRRWLLVDVDPVRASGISSNECEHSAAIQRAKEILTSLRKCGWPDPIVADSGNGAHLLYRIDLSVDDAGLIQRCLSALASDFDNALAKVDTTVFNPARIWKLCGTFACKGDNTPDRPHRMARMLSVPDKLERVPPELLEALAAMAPIESPAKLNHHRSHVNSNDPLDVAAFIDRHKLDVDGPYDWNGQQGHGRRWTFRKSPLCDHHDGAAFILQHATGAISAECHHNSCSWKWKDLRARLEPSQLLRPTPTYRATTAPREVISAQPFPVSVLPGAVGAFVVEAAAAIGCDASFIALPLLACLARAIGNKRVIRIKPTWTEPAIVWAAIVGKSGAPQNTGATNGDGSVAA